MEPLLWDYRKDFWWKPLTSLLQLGLRCSYLAGRPDEYLIYALELCSADIRPHPHDLSQSELFRHLTDLLQSKKIPPLPPGGDSTDASASAAIRMWTERLNALPEGSCLSSVVVNTISSLVAIKASFTQREFDAQEPIRIQVDIR